MIALALTFGIPLLTLAASFNAKPCAWHMSMNTLIVRNPLPPEAMASMPPENRAKVEQAMNERAARPVTVTHKLCVTQENPDQDRIIHADNDDGKSARKIVSKSATRLVIEQTGPALPASTSQMPIDATTCESLSSSIVRVRGEGKGKVLGDIKGFWLGPNCAAINDDD